MREIDIRRALRRQVMEAHKGEEGTRFVEELGVCQGIARVDLAVVNGSIHGYEIKSEQDNLLRLPNQTAIYNRVFDFVTVVVAPPHLEKVKHIVPKWWGISTVSGKTGDAALISKRRGTRNPDVDAYALAQLLWRNEALEVIEAHNLARHVRSKPRKFLWSLLAEELSIEELGCAVRELLKRRPAGSLGSESPALCGDSYRPSAKSSRSQAL